MKSLLQHEETLKLSNDSHELEVTDKELEVLAEMAPVTQLALWSVCCEAKILNTIPNGTIHQREYVHLPVL